MKKIAAFILKTLLTVA